MPINEGTPDSKGSHFVELNSVPIENIPDCHDIIYDYLPIKGEAPIEMSDLCSKIAAEKGLAMDSNQLRQEITQMVLYGYSIVFKEKYYYRSEWR